MELFGSGGTDWSGHGFVTVYCKFLVTISSTDNARVHVITNVGYSYLQNTPAAYAYDNWTVSTPDSDTLYIDFRFASNQSGTPGWKPNWDAITYDASTNGLVNSVTVIN